MSGGALVEAGPDFDVLLCCGCRAAPGRCGQVTSRVRSEGQHGGVPGRGRWGGIWPATIATAQQPVCLPAGRQAPYTAACQPEVSTITAPATVLQCQVLIGGVAANPHAVLCQSGCSGVRLLCRRLWRIGRSAAGSRLCGPRAATPSATQRAWSRVMWATRPRRRECLREAWPPPTALGRCAT